MDERFLLILGDCAKNLSKVDDMSIDLVVTSPPYDNLRQYKGYSFEFEKIARELYRVIKPGGIIVWIVGDATINGSETGASFRQALFFKEIGFSIHDTMILQKVPIPYDPKCKRYWQAFEYMFVFSKGSVKTCNYLTEKCIYAGKTKPDDYGHRYPNGLKRIDRKNKNRVVKETKVKHNIWFYDRKRVK